MQVRAADREGWIPGVGERRRLAGNSIEPENRRWGETAIERLDENVHRTFNIERPTSNENNECLWKIRIKISAHLLFKAWNLSSLLCVIRS